MFPVKYFIEQKYNATFLYLCGIYTDLKCQRKLWFSKVVFTFKRINMINQSECIANN